MRNDAHSLRKPAPQRVGFPVLYHRVELLLVGVLGHGDAGRTKRQLGAPIGAVGGDEPVLHHREKSAEGQCRVARRHREISAHEIALRTHRDREHGE